MSEGKSVVEGTKKAPAGPPSWWPVPADLVQHLGRPVLEVAYHTVSFSFQALCPLGGAAGGALALVRARRGYALLSSAGTGAALGGVAGIGLGLAAFGQKYADPKATGKAPAWDEAGLLDRAERLRVNALCRTMDAYSMTGLVAGVVVSPLYKNMGMIRCGALGTSVGAVCALAAFLAQTKPWEKKK